ncbi:hypothetical protein ABIB25_000705 [Nakamurella sp. UYEF19]|uniref:hypothetical protein n=1 Tax=Nakamurella sp. UYEF19 TaxID=1756392 RepID=UPI003399E553
MSQAAGQRPISIPPPPPVAASGLLMCLQALGVVILTTFILVSGFANSAAAGQLLAQAAYFLVIAALMVVCGVALLKGRRWGRTPTIVVQIVIGAVGYWLAVPSGRPVWGILLIVLAVVTGGLLMTKPANAWVSRFPSLFGPEPDR